MNFVKTRSDLCEANFEDFDTQQRGIVCPTCNAVGIVCLGGSHPHRQQAASSKVFSFKDVDQIQFGTKPTMSHNFVKQVGGSKMCSWCGDEKNVDAERDCPRTQVTVASSKVFSFKDVEVLLQKNIHPKRNILRKMAKTLNANELDYIQADPSGERAYEIYITYEMLPQTLTCQVVEKALRVRLNGPCMGDDKPFLLSANYYDGRPAMVKVLRIDLDSEVQQSKKVAEYNMERGVLDILDFSGKQPGLVRAEFFEVQVPKEATEVLTGTTSIPLKEGRPASTVYAILMPRYITTVGKSPKFEVEHLQRQFRKMFDTLTYIHSCNIVHLDVKSDNIFVGGDGEWVLGDFGSCKLVGEEVITTTAQYHHTKLTGKKAVVGFDFFMLLMTLLIELLPNKNAFGDALCAPQEFGIVYASLQKVNAATARAKVEFPSMRKLIEDIERVAV